MTTPTTPRFNLGQPVQITGQVTKRQLTSGAPGMAARTTYQPTGAPTDRGIIVGYRTIQDHALQWGFDEGTTAQGIPGTARRAWLVAWHLRRRPILCLDSQVDPITPDTEEPTP